MFEKLILDLVDVKHNIQLINCKKRIFKFQKDIVNEQGTKLTIAFGKEPTNTVCKYLGKTTFFDILGIILRSKLFHPMHIKTMKDKPITYECW